MEEGAGDEDQRRESALASTPLFNPNFKSSKVSQAQLDKFKVLFLSSLPSLSLGFLSDEIKYRGDIVTDCKTNPNLD